MTTIFSEHYLATRTKPTTTTPAHVETLLATQRKTYKINMVWNWLLSLPMHFGFDDRLSKSTSETEGGEYGISEDDEGVEDDCDGDSIDNDEVGNRGVVMKQQQQQQQRRAPKPAAKYVYMSELPPRYRKRMRIKGDDEEELMSRADVDVDVKARLAAAMKTMEKREEVVKSRPKRIPRSRKVGVSG